jgi:type II secretory pathway component GspD/PulD (secretin)
MDAALALQGVSAMRPILVLGVVWVCSLMLLGGFANPAVAQQPAPVPIKVNSTVTVPDGGTVMIASSTTTVQTRTESGTPILSKVPYLKRGFTNVSYGQSMKRSSVSVSVRIIDLKAEDERMLKGK